MDNIKKSSDYYLSKLLYILNNFDIEERNICYYMFIIKIFYNKFMVDYQNGKDTKEYRYNVNKWDKRITEFFKRNNNYKLRNAYPKVRNLLVRLKKRNKVLV